MRYNAHGAPAFHTANHIIEHERFLASLHSDARARFVEESFAPPIALLDAGDYALAAEALTDLALRHSHPAIRTIAAKALPAFAVEASPGLIEVLSENRADLGDEIWNGIRHEPGNEAFHLEAPEGLPAFLAGEALERFGDYDTGFALIGVVGARDGVAKSRAARVLGRMSPDIALPVLAWSQDYARTKSERKNAAALLKAIVARPDQFDVTAEGAAQPISTFAWLAEFSDRDDAMGQWGENPVLALPILSNAISLGFDLNFPSRLNYDEPTLGRASRAERSVSFIQSAIDFVRLPPARYERFPDVAFSDRPNVGDELTLTVFLREASVEAGEKPVPVEFPRGKSAIDLLVHVSSPAFSCENDFQTITVPREGQSSKAVFRLKALRAGPAAVDIKFFLGAETIGHCCALTTIAEAGDVAAATPTRSPGDQAPVVETSLLTPLTTHVFASVDAEALERPRETKCVIFAEARDGVLHWRALETWGAIVDLGHSPETFSAEAIANWQASHSQSVREALGAELTSDQLEGVLANLRGVGHQIYAQVASKGLREFIANLPADSLITIQSDVDWLPWELLCETPDSEMLGDRFIIVRAPLINEPPDKDEVAGGGAPPPASATLERALLVVGDKTDASSGDPSTTFGKKAARAKPALIGSTWPALQAAAPQADIVHFICHGRSTPQYHLSLAAAPGSKLYPSMVKNITLRPGALVFANACDSAGADVLLAKFQSFGREFYQIGARPFIGTLGPVPEALSARFAKMFYESFAIMGLTAARAMRETKRKARDVFKTPIWLFYCLYGDSTGNRVWR